MGVTVGIIIVSSNNNNTRIVCEIVEHRVITTVNVKIDEELPEKVLVDCLLLVTQLTTSTSTKAECPHSLTANHCCAKNKPLQFRDFKQSHIT